MGLLTAMTYLCILIDKPLSFLRLDHPLLDSLTLHGTIYIRRPISGDEVVFYDWVIDETNTVRALEIHLPPDSALLQSSVPLNEVPLVETDCFVRIWFGDNRAGVAQGKEAFGGISFFGGGGNKLAIVLDLNSWLSPPERRSVLASLGLDELKRTTRG